MKTKHYLLTGILSIALTGMIITGCKKETTTSTNPATKTNPAVDNDYQASQDDANATFAINDTKYIADGAMQGKASERMSHGASCATWTGDTSATTDTLIISFPGTCVSPDGKIRKGDIIVYWSRGKNYFDSGATVTMTYRNYSFTNSLGTTISISNSSYRTLTNLGWDSLGDHSWSFSASMTLTYSTGGTATWNASRTNILTKIGGFYYYTVTGGASGTSKSGTTYTLNITSPLIYAANWINWVLYAKNPCYCVESGQVTYTRTGKIYPLILTYTSGTGNCNYTATATINSVNYYIIL